MLPGFPVVEGVPVIPGVPDGLVPGVVWVLPGEDDPGLPPVVCALATLKARAITNAVIRKCRCILRGLLEVSRVYVLVGCDGKMRVCTHARRNPSANALTANTNTVCLSPTILYFIHSYLQ